MAQKARYLELVDHPLVVGELHNMGCELSENFQDVVVRCGPGGRLDGRQENGCWTQTGVNDLEDGIITILDSEGPDEERGEDPWEGFNDEEEETSIIENEPSTDPILARGRKWITENRRH